VSRAESLTPVTVGWPLKTRWLLHASLLYSGTKPGVLLTERFNGDNDFLKNQSLSSNIVSTDNAQKIDVI
jgi:hypothetical protein